MKASVKICVHKNTKYNKRNKKFQHEIWTFTPSLEYLGIYFVWPPFHGSAVHNAYIEQLTFLPVFCAKTMPQKSQKIYDGTYLFPGADNSEENRENLIFVSLKL